MHAAPFIIFNLNLILNGHNELPLKLNYENPTSALHASPIMVTLDEVKVVIYHFPTEREYIFKKL